MRYFFETSRNRSNIIEKIKKIKPELYRRLKISSCYKNIVSKNAPWIVVAYVSDAFYHRNNEMFLNIHQNKKETLAMADVFTKMGYNSLFIDSSYHQKLPDYDVKMVFGQEPNFMMACKKYPAARKIYYGVSTYFAYRNEKIRLMTDEFNEKFKISIQYKRYVAPHESAKTADSILLIGSRNTVKTFPKEFQPKITLIHQSTQRCMYIKDIKVAGNKEFIFLASGGNALKGVCPLLEFFSSHKEYILHWIGPVENEVKMVLKRFELSNVCTYGFQDISNNLVLGLMERCDFILYPSGAEGVPGSVLNAMKSGLIPLVTPWASFDEIEDYGFVMEDATLKGVESAVTWAMSLSKEEIDKRKRACQKFVLENYNLSRFTKEFEEYMKRQLTEGIS